MSLIVRHNRSLPVRKAKGDPIVTPVGMGLTEHERAVRDATRKALSDLYMSSSFARAQSAFATPSASAIDALAWTQFAEQMMTIAAPLQSHLLLAGALKENIPKKYQAVMSFDATDPRAIAWANAHAASAVREITNATREAIQIVISDAVSGKYSGDDAAIRISQVVGLTKGQTRSVTLMYERTIAQLLEAGFSPQIARKRAATAAAGYRDRLVGTRAETIARTEIMRAANNGRYLSWAQGVEAGYISDKAYKKWNTYPGFGSNGPCDVCSPMNGLVVRWDEAFPNGAMMPPIHARCRCTATLLPPDEGRKRVRDVPQVDDTVAVDLDEVTA